jgi:hypothetical protein
MVAEGKVYFLNVLLEVDSQSAESLGDFASDLKRVGNYFLSLNDAKEAQKRVINALKK